MITFFKKILKLITSFIQKLIRSFTFRITFFMIFALTVANVLAGGIMMLLYQTNLGSKMGLTPITLTIIVLAFSYVSTATFSVIFNRNVTLPLRKLTKLTKEIENGNYNVDTKGITNFYSKRTDVGALVDAFGEMTQELSSTEIFRSDFIHNFSHEFKTPIISIRGFAKQLCENDLSDEQKKEFAKIILDESEHLANMSSNVLLLSRLESQEIITDKELFSLDEQLRNCMLIFEEQWSEKNIEIIMDLDEVEYFQNQDLLFHVWTNLIGNAVKFTPENGNIEVCCHHSNDCIYVKIKDNGIGMSSDTAAHIFEKFYQGDLSHATNGNGLGLPLVKQILSMMNGRITVDSALDKGTSFTVSLPK